MYNGNDPAIVTVGVSMGSIQSSVEKVMGTTDDVLTRTLHIARLAALSLPVIIFSFWIHDVPLVMWLFRLGVVYGCCGLLGMSAMPEQMYSGLGLGAMQWMFEMVYPDGTFQPSSTIGAKERALIQLPVLDRRMVHIRIYGTTKSFAVAPDGPWLVAADVGYPTNFVLQQVMEKGKNVPDTYTLRVHDSTSDYDGFYLSFQAINHLRFGGWAQLVRGQRNACPYKIVRDSSCQGSSLKMLCAWTGVPPPTSRYCTGFYLAERRANRQAYLAHAADCDAAHLELILGDSVQGQVGQRQGYTD
mmetsp:Transcript_20218/g.47172  ORF Transcript_20218/g.47172 Transcript_20218/m.47172 type:complete len:301 (-) Transcript_20218:61-963(-)